MNKDFVLPSFIKQAITLLADYEVYLVGGCVRDFLLGKNPSDFDLCTSALPDEIQAVFSEYKTVLTGVKHGTVTVIIDGFPIEITTFRTELPYNDHRRPDGVCFVKDINEDLARRDFTINAIAYHPDRGFVDPYGGASDISRRIIRTVGEPQERFSEDALRVLRCVRFSATLDFEIEEKTKTELSNYANELGFVAKERQLVEINKLFSAENSVKISEVIEGNKEVFFAVFPSLIPTEDCTQETKYHRYTVLKHSLEAIANTPADKNLRFAMLLHDTGKPKAKYFDAQKVAHFHGHAKISKYLAKNDLQNLRIDNKSAEYILKLIEMHGDEMPHEKADTLKFWNEHGYEFCMDLNMVQTCDLLGKSDYSIKLDSQKFIDLRKFYEDLYKKSPCYKLSDLAINGDDLKNMGYSGKEIGERLGFLLGAVMKDNVNNDMASLKKYLKRF